VRPENFVDRRGETHDAAALIERLNREGQDGVVVGES
jgi:hypothetical protein